VVGVSLCDSGANQTGSVASIFIVAVVPPLLNAAMAYQLLLTAKRGREENCLQSTAHPLKAHY